MTAEKNPRRPGVIFGNLKVRVTLLLLIVSLVPLGIVSLIMIRAADELIISLVSGHLESLADDKRNLLERWLGERKADLKVVASSEIVMSLDPRRLSAYLQLVQSNYGAYQGFVVISSEGKTVFDNTGGSGDYRGRDWSRAALAGKSYQSEVNWGPGKKESVFLIAAPIFGAAGEVRGAAGAVVGTHAILSIILRLSLGRTGECYLVDRNGTFLAHQDPRRIFTENIAQSGSFKKIFSGPELRRVYRDYRGIEVLGSSRHIEGTDWYLVVEQDRAEAFADVFRMRRYLYLTIVLSILVAVLLAWRFGNYLVNPIQELNAAALALSRGEFEGTTLPTGRPDEIGALAVAFAEMAQKLRARQNTLEAKVDLTTAELKETDARLKMTEALAVRSERLAALGRLAAGVTHEIRTPLTSLKLFLQSAKDELEGTPEAEEDLAVAMKQIARIEATINRFLDFARPQEPVWSTVDVAQLLEESLLVVEPRAHHQEVVIKKEIAAGLPPVSGDKKQLGEALLNLMVNALEAMSRKGRLTIAAAPEFRRLQGAPRECVRIDVADTGEGIANENLERLYDPFFTTKTAGTGLGLSIVASTVAAHGGEIVVNSRPGQGATFSLFLPALLESEREKYG